MMYVKVCHNDLQHRQQNHLLPAPVGIASSSTGRVADGVPPTHHSSDPDLSESTSSSPLRIGAMVYLIVLLTGVGGGRLARG